MKIDYGTKNHRIRRAERLYRLEGNLRQGHKLWCMAEYYKAEHKARLFHFILSQPSDSIRPIYFAN